MPYSKSEFDTEKQNKFKVSVASAAGTIAANVDIVSITEKRRRAGSSIMIEIKIRAADAIEMENLTKALGSGDTFEAKMNTELQRQGLSEATAFSPPEFSSPESTSSGGNTSMVASIVCGILGALVVVVLLSYCCWRKTKSSKVDPGIVDGDKGAIRASTPGLEVLEDVEEDFNPERTMERYKSLCSDCVTLKSFRLIF